ncbi:UbiE/COQ5 methyltransferase [Rhodoferax ferrireducens T118]|uniref:UbiE/COQ5 methyltransferase n=1 Tax=Albidiferax ferrireducens (strain ATCC BAA-621 / DSM 15236 / T118) TaxID=338969 RepID=Q21SN3_ALBFT|nr:class I SAM-dependent methyltransferase [Rhodoferax ferrireducens]ABD71220.1 UbiE/COQ5 methyltransferase [Rhodoferax ferrireducens T118]
MAEQQPTFDAAKYKNAQREQWNKDGAAWRRWNPTLDRWYGEVTRKMLDLARIQPGQRILDIAAGAGEPAVSASERVGPSGYVLATDISEGIVELALQVARERGLKQIEARAMDGEKLDLPDASFDAVLCRLGLMYMPHPVTALREWRRALRPGGRVAVVVFSTPDRNSWGALPASIIRRRAQLPPPVPGQPGPFSLGAPRVLENIFSQAEFANPEVHTVQVPLRMASSAEYVRVAREAFGGFNAMMAHLPPQERESVWNEVEGAMHSFDSPAGFEVPGECLVGAATK